MRITLDTNIVLQDLVRRASHGRLVLRDGRCEFLIAEPIRDETDEQIDAFFDRRVTQGRLDRQEQASEAAAIKALIDFHVRVERPSGYMGFAQSAKHRTIDPDDWPTVAVALATNSYIWTADKNHFWGCGIATWSTAVLAIYLGVEDPNGI